MFQTIGIVVAFLMLATTLAWLLVWGRGPWWARGIIGVFTAYAGLAMWLSVGSVAGWPSDDNPPSGGIDVGAAMVREPSRDGKDAGAIFIWGTPVIAEQQSKVSRWIITMSPSWGNEPRCWRIPYSRELHQKVDDVQRALKQGRKVIAKSGEAPQGVDEVKPNTENGTEQQRRGLNGQISYPFREDGLRFYDLPLGGLPKKKR